MQPKLWEILLAFVGLATITTTSIIGHAQAARVLGLFPHASESHYAVMRSIVLELVRRGHNVTLYSSHRMNELNLQNVEEHIIEPEFSFWQTVHKHAIGDGNTNHVDLAQLSTLQPAAMQQALATAGAASIEYFLQNPSVKELLNLARTNEFNYDLIMVDIFYSEALLAIGQGQRTPTIGIVSENFENYMQHVLESILTVACSPNDGNIVDTYSTLSDFWMRLGAIRECLQRRKRYLTSNLAAQENIIKKHFDGYGTTLQQLQSTIALLLFNTHTLLERPRVLLPNTIFAGGFHIRPPRELPWHVLRFVEESRIGVIYIHLGDAQMCANVPVERLRILFKVLGTRRERVLWTCHDVNKLPELPNNFMLLQHVAAQTDILAHPHIKMFLMNGDLLGVQEAIMRNVPLLTIPLFREEIRNADVTVQLGIGVKLDYGNFTEDALQWALNTLLREESYQLTIRQVSKLYRDRPLGALETCMYWMEYLLRHGTGGAELRSSIVSMPSNHLHLFDLFIFYFIVAILITSLVAGMGYGILVLLSRRTQQQQPDKMFSKLK